MSYLGFAQFLKASYKQGFILEYAFILHYYVQGQSYNYSEAAVASS